MIFNAFSAHLHLANNISLRWTSGLTRGVDSTAMKASVIPSVKPHMSADVRRSRMAAIRKKDTKPEMIVRKLLWMLGARYRVHVNALPGCPDVVIRSKKLVLFVHGCLWHLHDDCRLARVPKSKPDYWPAKLARNKERDRLHLAELGEAGWTVEVIWECETRDPLRLEKRLGQILSAARATIA
jgi:DNA mismatch endonuclease (patch repair protein)